MTSSRVQNARRDALVLTVLITAVLLLIWNGSSFFSHLRFASGLDSEVRVASTALTLNVALILFGWRRYVDLQHEAELREEQERRAAVLATTDPVTGLFNRKGFADEASDLGQRCKPTGCSLVIMSLQVQRFKTVNEQHGYETGDRLLKSIAAALTEILGDEAVVARLSGDEFAIALGLESRTTRRSRSGR